MVSYNQAILAEIGISRVYNVYTERESLVEDPLDYEFEPTLELCVKMQRVSSVNGSKESDKLIYC